MDSAKFKRSGLELIEWAINYMETLDERKCLPDVEPGWLANVLPKEAPQKGEPFTRIFGDIEKVVLEGMVHWQHHQFFAYFPAGNSWASVLGDMLANAVAVNGANWGSCPVVSELELLVCDWCCKFLGLPDFFLSKMSNPESAGTGLIQHSASESIFYAMIYAREDAIRKLRMKYPNKPRAMFANMLVAYCNCECHCCVERGALMGVVRLQKLQSNANGSVRGDTLRKAIEDDIAAGHIPFFHVAIIGSTGVTSSDNIMEIGQVCKEYGIWLHVDAAYAGPIFACPEMRHLIHGFEYVWSTNMNCNKWMLTNFEASLHWIRYASKAVDPMTGCEEGIYSTPYPPDLKHYGVASQRRFKAIKLWLVIRDYGVDGLRKYCRNHVNLAKLFEMYVRTDDRFEVCGPVRYGLVAFRLRGLNEVTSRLLDVLNFSRQLHMVPTHFHDKVCIRFALCAEWANSNDIDRAWRKIDKFTSVILRQYEQEHGDDSSMSNLYSKQHRHDELQTLKKDATLAAEEAEAAKIVAAFDEKQDNIVHRVKQTSFDGSLNRGNEDLFQKFDAILKQRPELTHDEQFEDPNAGKIDSMLHTPTLTATKEHVKKRRSTLQDIMSAAQAAALAAAAASAQDTPPSN